MVEDRGNLGFSKKERINVLLEMEPDATIFVPCLAFVLYLWVNSACAFAMLALVVAYKEEDIATSKNTCRRKWHYDPAYTCTCTHPLCLFHRCKGPWQDKCMMILSSAVLMHIFMQYLMHSVKDDSSWDSLVHPLMVIEHRATRPNQNTQHVVLCGRSLSLAMSYVA